MIVVPLLIGVLFVLFGAAIINYELPNWRNRGPELAGGAFLIFVGAVILFFTVL
jgi:hypothetical protein